jgi:hypothetical protein
MAKRQTNFFQRFSHLPQMMQDIKDPDAESSLLQGGAMDLQAGAVEAIEN